jgi:hypothetical protein
MPTTSVEKAIIVQSSLILEEKRLTSDSIEQILAWNDVDLSVAADINLLKSAESTAVVFNDFIEPWKNIAGCEETLGNKKRLLKKYEGICIYDANETFTGRIVNVDWAKKVRSVTNHYAVSVQNLKARDDAEEVFPYMINECLHDMIKDSPVTNNSAFSLTPSKK